ncbi:MAG TPA: tRNA (adenosine(37)-N6)-threonylcarbamoyltransferase complex dimerization subunit type 1 TsaB [Chloroflexia bacterium]|nr:tRNA (adenosine(37)-N6)-threonylcarbamoyltransferase complex dimerization subunit type 1 TsaB [Chloroflexia bacterium]
MILAIDTSTEMAGIALYKPGDGVLAEQSWWSGREQTTQLLPNVQRLMSLVGTGIQEIKGVAVATGPGSFSGVRIGISTAKSMAYALQVPLWGVPSLDVLAYQQVAVTAAQVCAVLSMGRGRLAWALYRTRGTRWQRLTAYLNGTVQEMAQCVIPHENNLATIFCGEINAETAGTLSAILGKEAAIAPAAAAVRRAGYLAELALQRANRGEADDPATLQAIYLQPAIKT